jgi:hypothetical protein
MALSTNPTAAIWMIENGDKAIMTCRSAWCINRESGGDHSAVASSRIQDGFRSAAFQSSSSNESTAAAPLALL